MTASRIHNKYRSTLYYLVPGLLLAVMLGCTDPNEHFCSKYSFYYRELTAPDILPFAHLRPQLEADVKKEGVDADKSKMALFVMEEIEKGIKPHNEEPQAFCMRRERWKMYH